MKGLAISNSDLIRSVHNSFARSDLFVNEIQNNDKEKDEDIYHFIAYVPVHGGLYEIDGLSDGPVYVDNCTDDDWVTKANQCIENRMRQYGSAEINFSLMAVTRDRLEVYQEQIEELDGLLLSLPEDAEDERRRLNGERNFIEHKMQLEREKRQRWQVSPKLLCKPESLFIS